MHELSIALSILEMVDEEAERLGGVRVEAVHLKLGALSGVVSDALLAAFDLAREGFPSKDCRLLIEEVPVAVRCPNCRETRPAASIQHLACGVCGAPAGEVVCGRELEVVSLEIAN
jgi:hydrogenase nickel incorporation protein HypA/HybF